MIRRKRQLRKQSERIHDRGDKRYVPADMTFGAFIKRQKGLFIFAAILAVGIWGVKKLTPDKKVDSIMQNSIDAIISERTQEWDQSYPYGYKIIVFTDKEIMHTSFDTIAPDFRINWKELSVTRIQADQLERTEEKIKITPPKIQYGPQSVSSLSGVTAVISRKKGMKRSLGEFEKFEIILEIVDDREGRLLCLFGIKGN